jgi:hypothetical protein
MARQASAAREDYQNAVTRLKGLTVGPAIEAIMQAPDAVQEMLLVAEKLNGNRKSVLDQFGEPDPAALARWEEILEQAPQVEASEGTADEAKAEDAGE